MNEFEVHRSSQTQRISVVHAGHIGNEGYMKEADLESW